MADTTPAPTDPTNSATPAAANPNPETTLTKDGALPINQTPAATDDQKAAAPATPATTTSKPLTDELAQSLMASDAPTGDASLITPQEAAEADSAKPAAAATPSPLTAQVETLNGEINSLQSKIDTLPATPGEKTPSTTPLKPDLPASTPAAVTKEVTSKAAQVDALPPLPGDPKTAASKAASGQTAVAAFNDVFTKSDKKSPAPATPAPAATKPPTATPVTPAPAAKAPTMAPDSAPSSMAMVGEVFSIVGVILLAIVLIGPFYQGLLSTRLYNAISTVGWIVAPITLVLGFIFLLFSKGRGLTKIVILLLALFSIVAYLGINGPSGIADPINTLFGSILMFYR